MAYRILRRACTGCGKCIDECPMDAISIDAEGHYCIDPELCTDCGSCADICPEGAITGA